MIHIQQSNKDAHQTHVENVPYLPERKTTLTSAKGKYIYPNLRQPHPPPPKIKYLLRKNILLLMPYIKYTKHISFDLPLPISVTVSIFTVSAFISLTHTPNIPIPFTATPQYIIIISPSQWNGYTTLLKTLQWLLGRCATMPLWATLTEYYIFISGL